MTPVTQRRCHFIKHNKGTETSSSLLFFDTETWPFGLNSTTPIIGHKLRLGVVSHFRLEDSEITRREVLRFKTAEQFWEFLHSKLSSSRPLICYAHNLIFDFRILGGFSKLIGWKGQDWKLVLSNPPTILKGKIDGCSVSFIDSMNYYRSSLAAIGRDVGIPKDIMPAFTATDEAWWDYCEQDVRILETAIVSLHRLIRDNDLGVMGPTVSACAMHAWRHRFMNVPVAVHDNLDAVQLERRAYYGGRCEAYRIGSIQGDAWRVDVNSLYPYVMRRHLYPSKLVGIFDRPPIEWMARNLTQYGGVASVWVECGEDRYPKRRDEGPIYPVGVYRTTLCGAELESAVNRGHVIGVQRCALYVMADLFSEYVDFFYAMKKEHNQAGNSTMRLLSKLFLNSLYGKFAQNSPRFVSRPEYPPPTLWGPFQVVNSIKGTKFRALAIAGHTLEETDRGEAFDNLVAISAFVTSYGRVYMDDLKRRAGLPNVHYEDTDSLIVNTAGLDNLALAGLIGSDGLGELRGDGIADVLTVHGLKDYQFGHKKVLAGVRRDAIQLGEDDYRQYVAENLFESWRRADANTVLFVETTPHLNREYKKRVVHSDGTTRPLEIFEAFDDGFDPNTDH